VAPPVVSRLQSAGATEANGHDATFRQRCDVALFEMQP